MNKKEHTLLLIMGRTGAGKDKLVNHLCDTGNLKQLISYSTRPRRQDEGDTHIFVDESDYFKMLESREVAVDTKISDNYYWSKIEQLYESDVYIVDYLGFKKLKKLNLPNIRFVSVYINVPDEIREERAINLRHDDKNIFRKRNLDERRQFREMLQAADFDYSIQNIRFPEAYSVLKWIATVEGVFNNKGEVE